MFYAQVISYYKYPGTKLENSNAEIYQGMIHIFKYKVCVYTSTAPFINPESIYQLYTATTVFMNMKFVRIYIAKYVFYKSVGKEHKRVN